MDLPVGARFVQVQVDAAALAVVQDEVPRPVAGPGKDPVYAALGG